jgi:hypothetical protein
MSPAAWVSLLLPVDEPWDGRLALPPDGVAGEAEEVGKGVSAVVAMEVLDVDG